MSTAETSKPRIYVACLASYNAGRLHGTWIDCNQGPSEIYDAINRMLKRSPVAGAEEWAIHDYENWDELSLSESEDIESLSQIAEALDEHGPIYSSLLTYLGGTDSKDEAERFLHDRYQGSWSSFREFAEDQADELFLPSFPELAQRYFDYESWTRDLECSGEYLALEVEGKTHVFCLY